MFPLQVHSDTQSFPGSFGKNLLILVQLGIEAAEPMFTTNILSLFRKFYVVFITNLSLLYPGMSYVLLFMLIPITWFSKRRFLNGFFLRWPQLFYFRFFRPYWATALFTPCLHFVVHQLLKIKTLKVQTARRDLSLIKFIWIFT